jgi:hypothetical protein
MPIYTSAFGLLLLLWGCGVRVLGFFEIEMDNNRQIVCTFWSASNLLQIAYSGCLWCFSFTESLILAQDERWRRA